MYVSPNGNVDLKIYFNVCQNFSEDCSLAAPTDEPPPDSNMCSSVWNYFTFPCVASCVRQISSTYIISLRTGDTASWWQDRQSTYNVTLSRVRETTVPMKKQYVLYILCVYICVCVALVIQDAERMRRIFICGLSGSTIFFHIISLTERFFGKKLSNIKCVF